MPWIPTLVGALVAALAVFAACALLIRLPSRLRLALAAAALLAFASILLARPFGSPAAGLAGLAVAPLLGVPAGRRLAHPTALAAFLVAASLVDLVAWLAGPTRGLVDAFVAGESDLLLYLLVSVPWRGTWRAALGLGDVLVLAVAHTALVAGGVPRWRAAAVLLLGLAAALAVAATAGSAPVVPFLAAFALLGSGRGVEVPTR